MNTPWGKANFRKIYAPGVTFYTTSGHGGFKVSKTALALMPLGLRNNDGWYEEDLEWCKVVIAFPHLFTPALVDATKKLHTQYFTSEGAYTSDEFRDNLRKLKMQSAPPPAYL